MYLQLNTRFNPFTYDEMVKPLVQYKEAYDKIEQDYSNLVTQTEMWKDIANQVNSPEAYGMYDKYSTRLNAAVEELSKGLTMNTRSQLLEMKRQYAQSITPIAMADVAMKSANELRAKAGPDAIFEVGEYSSLDDFLHGKTANNRYQSRAALTKQTAAITEAAMAEALRDPEFRNVMGGLSIITQHTGGSYNDLIEAMKLGALDNPIIQNRFSQIRQNIIRKSGIQNYDAAGQQAILDAIDTGLYAGLDKPIRNFQNNQSRGASSDNSAELSFSAARQGLVKDVNGNWVYDPERDPAVARASKIAEIKASNKSSSTSTGSNSSNRETLSSSPVFIDTKKPKNSKPVKKEDVRGTKLNLEDFEDDIYTSNGVTLSRRINRDWDNIVMDRSGKNLSTNILKNTGESTLEDAFRKYDIYIDSDGNLYADPRNVKIYGNQESQLDTGSSDFEDIGF